MKKYTPEEIEQMSDDALKEIHQHTMLCDNDHEEHIFLCGFNSGFHAKCEDLSKNKINNKNGSTKNKVENWITGARRTE